VDTLSIRIDSESIAFDPESNELDRLSARIDLQSIPFDSESNEADILSNRVDRAPAPTCSLAVSLLPSRARGTPCLA